ncbi:Selenoprotein O [Balamuthia mandrillaris]
MQAPSLSMEEERALPLHKHKLVAEEDARVEEEEETGASADPASPFRSLPFDNLAIRSLPIDPVFKNHTRQVPNACFSLVRPTRVEQPRLVVASTSALALIGFPAEAIEEYPEEMATYFSGNRVLKGARPAAHCYCGHQFGYFSGQLGDGATMYLGEIVNHKGERWEIQFKGAGKTPYSRTADGRKVLRSSLREFLCSEAIHHLGIPTTRAGTCVTSSSWVKRDIFYNGNPKDERCTIILRIAPTFLRFGSFEIFKGTDEYTGRTGPSEGNKAILLQLLHYTIRTFYPEIWSKYHAPPDQDKVNMEREHDADVENTFINEEMYLEFYQEVVLRTARLVAAWQCVGWCHGVLNTDNMSILGLTIDYGPFGFMESFDPHYICNGSDNEGRYSYENQPEMCHWNCLKLAEALEMVLPLAKSKPLLENTFMTEFRRAYHEKMRQKLGLLNKDWPGDTELIKSLLDTMHETGADWTNTLRSLARISIPKPSQATKYTPKEPQEEKEKEAEEVEGEEEDQEIEDLIQYLYTQMLSASQLKKREAPSIPIDKLKGLLRIAQQDPRMLALFGLQNPAMLLTEWEKWKKAKLLEDLTPEKKRKRDAHLWRKWLRSYKHRLSMEAQSDDEVEELNKKRVSVMNLSNPKYILRNWIAQRAIEAAEEGNYDEAKHLLRILEDPYAQQPITDELAEQDGRHYGRSAPEELDICVT